MESANKNNSLFKKIDSYLFEQIDLFKTSSLYIKFVETLNSLSLEHRLVLNQLVTLFLISFPFIILLAVFISNFQLKKSLETKKEILQVSNDILSYQRELQTAKGFVFSYPPIKNSSDLDVKIRNALSKSSIDLKSVSTQNFQLDSSIPNIFRTNADIVFSKLNINQLVDLTSHLIRFEKIKISGLSISKDSANGLLKGKLQISHYGEERLQ